MTERKNWFDRAYNIGIGIKGFDGLAELVVGILLAITPGAFHTFLQWMTGSVYKHEGFVYEFSADYIARLDDDLARIGMTFIVVYLIGHGIIKIIFALCLLKRIDWIYPYAITILWLLMVYQVGVLLQDLSSIFMWLITVVDATVIWLVMMQYRKIRRAKRKERTLSKI